MRSLPQRVEAVARRALLAAAALAAAGSAVASGVSSDYSSVEPADCLLFQKEALGEGRVCPGKAGFNLVVSRFDGRAALELVRPEWGRNAVAPVTAVAPEYSWVSGKLAEWRMGPDGPVALILRIGVSPTLDRPDPVETRLLVLKVDAASVEDTCLVGAVSGRAGGNEAARAMADQAPNLPCLR